MKIFCPLIQRWLPQFVSGSLDPLRARMLASHLADCDGCQTQWQQQCELEDLLTPRSRPLDIDWEAIWERAEFHRGSGSTQEQRRSRSIAWGLSLAGATFVLVGWLGLGPAGLSIPQGNDPSSIVSAPTWPELRQEPLPAGSGSPDSKAMVFVDEPRKVVPRVSKPIGRRRVTRKEAMSVASPLERTRLHRPKTVPAQEIQVASRLNRQASFAEPQLPYLEPNESGSDATASPIEAVEQAALAQRLFH